MSAVEVRRIRLPKHGEIVGVRALLRAQMEKRGFNYADLSKEIGRGSTYIHEYVTKGSPRRLAEHDRFKLAAILELHPDQLREEQDQLCISGAAELMGEALAPFPQPAAQALPGRMVPLYGERDRLDPTQAKQWAPPFAGPAGPAAAAITIYTPAAGRLMPGDVCYTKSDIPVRAGDLVVLMAEEDSRITALGELTGLDAENVGILQAGTPDQFSRTGHRLLKIVGTIHP